MPSKKSLLFIMICLLISISTLYHFIPGIAQIIPRSFLNATSFSRVNFSIPDPIIYHTLPNCSSLSSKNSTNMTLNYTISVQQILYTYHELDARYNASVYPGGHWYPTTCQTEQRLAIIVCYRKREEHLNIFLNHIHSFLQKQQLDYTIFVVNQHTPETFNRAALFNVGFLEASKLYPFDCFIFHDVDLLPEDLRNIYKCVNQPRHMYITKNETLKKSFSFSFYCFRSVAVDKFNYKLLYATLFGGVTAFTKNDFIGANGYPTVYWGWGGEDDDMYLRVVTQLKKAIVRYPIEIARYKMIRTYHQSAPLNPNRRKILHSKYDYNLDGINTTQYKLHQVTFYKLFTLLNVTLIEETYEQIRTRLKIK